MREGAIPRSEMARRCGGRSPPALIAIVPLLVGCSLTTDLDGLSDATTGAGDPTSSGVTTGSGTTTGGGGAGGQATGSGGSPQTTTGSSMTTGSGGVGCSDLGVDNILPNGDMEEGVMSSDGSGWDSFLSVLTENTEIPHGGAKAITMCGDSSVIDAYTTYSDIDNAGSLGGSVYQASICVRTLPGSVPPAGMTLVLREQGSGSSTDHVGTPLTLLDTWQKLTTIGTIVDPANTKLVLIVAADGAPSNCNVIDDAVVEKIQ